MRVSLTGFQLGNASPDCLEQSGGSAERQLPLVVRGSSLRARRRLEVERQRNERAGQGGVEAGVGGVALEVVAQPAIAHPQIQPPGDMEFGPGGEVVTEFGGG